MNRYVISAVLYLAVGTALAGTWETSGFRTANGQLIRVGMSKAEVRRDAGKPLDRDKAAREKGEVWTYKGSDGIYSVRFKGDKVGLIEVAPLR